MCENDTCPLQQSSSCSNTRHRSSLHTPSSPASQLQVEQKQHPNNRNKSQPSYYTMLRHCLTIFCALDIWLAKILCMYVKYRCFAHFTSGTTCKSIQRHMGFLQPHVHIIHQASALPKESAKHCCALFFNISDRDNQGRQKQNMLRIACSHSKHMEIPPKSFWRRLYTEDLIHLIYCFMESCWGSEQLIVQASQEWIRSLNPLICLKTLLLIKLE